MLFNPQLLKCFQIITEAQPEVRERDERNITCPNEVQDAMQSVKGLRWRSAWRLWLLLLALLLLWLNGLG